MKINFHPLAKLELLEALTFYEKQDLKLGLVFAKEIHASLDRIRQFPEAWAKTFKRCRRCLVNQFPYGIVYRIGEITIIVFAVMHLKKNPKSLFDRIR